MMASGEDFIGLPYTNKKHPVRWVHQHLAPCPMAENGFQEVRGLGFGFTMTSRKCLQILSDTYRKYTDLPHQDKIANIFGQVYDVYLRGSKDPTDEVLLSEDFSISKRWRDIGGKVKLYLKSGIIMHNGGYAYSARDIPGGIIS